MSSDSVDLLSIFADVSKALRQNKEQMNAADQYNHDHGSNMVKTFSTITRTMKANQGMSQKDALEKAAETLSRKSTSSSSQLYARGLQQAAQQVSGDRVDPQQAMQVLQSLLGGGQTMNSGDAVFPGSAVSSQPSSGGDLLGSLLSGLGQNSSGSTGAGLQDGLDLGDLFTAGMAFMQSKQSGADNMNALVAAFTAASGMGNTPHRQQSTQLVVDTFLKALQKKQR